MQKQDRPVAFFDSGLGGISVLRETVRLLPQENYLYYGDSLHAPLRRQERSADPGAEPWRRRSIW